MTTSVASKQNLAELFRRAGKALKLVNSLLIDIVKRNQNVLMLTNWISGAHRIETWGNPINLKVFRQPDNLEDKIDKAICKLSENKIIKKCNSPWNTPLICIWKRNNNT